MKILFRCCFTVICFFSVYQISAQSGMTIQSGGQVTINGNTVITPNGFVCGSLFTDLRDGKSYHTVLIGTQCWMKENMDIGTRIAGNVLQSNNMLLEKYCYGNDEANCAIYGGMYQWDEAMQYSSIPGGQGICPTGWHIPTDVEYGALSTILGGDNFASGNMKETGTDHWLSPNTGATNSSGFTALPGGFKEQSGPFDGLTGLAFLWSSSPLSNGIHAWVLKLYHSNSVLFPEWNERSYGFSVRCVRN